MKQSKQFYHKVWAEKICTHIPLTMNLAEKLKLDYEIRLREAPSNKLWSQYARWEASQGRVRAACVICERYLDSTADPSEDMWLLYAELSPSRSMKLDIFLPVLSSNSPFPQDYIAPCYSASYRTMEHHFCL